MRAIQTASGGGRNWRPSLPIQYMHLLPLVFFFSKSSQASGSVTDPYLSLDACVRFVETVSAGVVLLVVRRPEGKRMDVG